MSPAVTALISYGNAGGHAQEKIDASNRAVKYSTMYRQLTF